MRHMTGSGYRRFVLSVVKARFWARDRIDGESCLKSIEIPLSLLQDFRTLFSGATGVLFSMSSLQLLCPAATSYPLMLRETSPGP